MALFEVAILEKPTKKEIEEEGKVDTTYMMAEAPKGTMSYTAANLGAF